MDEPKFKARRKRELESALNWGKSKLLLDSWTMTLEVDIELGDNLGIESHHPSTRESVIAVDRKSCRKDDVDPICTLFHELAHVTLCFTDFLKKSKEYTNSIELTCNIFGKLLFELWEYEHGC